MTFRMSLIKILHYVRKQLWKLTRPTTVGVRAILIKEEKVLLVKHSYQKHWYLPGGGVEKGETIDEAIKRELQEELGVNVEKLQLFGTYSNFYENKNDHIVIFYSDEFLTGEANSAEIEEWRFFEIYNLPEKISPGSKRRIMEFIVGNRSNFGKW